VTTQHLRGWVPQNAGTGMIEKRPIPDMKVSPFVTSGIAVYSTWGVVLSGLRRLWGAESDAVEEAPGDGLPLVERGIVSRDDSDEWAGCGVYDVDQ
jgi:hypothetical protein